MGRKKKDVIDEANDFFNQELERRNKEEETQTADDENDTDETPSLEEELVPKEDLIDLLLDGINIDIARNIVLASCGDKAADVGPVEGIFRDYYLEWPADAEAVVAAIKKKYIEQRSIMNEFKVPLTRDESYMLGQEVSKDLVRVRDLEAALAGIKKQYAGDIESLLSNIRNKSEKVNNGFEYRQVPVDITRDYLGCQLMHVRRDTGEVLVDGPIPAEQMEMKI